MAQEALALITIYVEHSAWCFLLVKRPTNYRVDDAPVARVLIKNDLSPLRLR